MQLIDADARVTVQSFDPMNEEYSEREMTVEEALDFATDEGCPSTIKAIPIEWLEHLRDSYPHRYNVEPSVISLILFLWRKEQEENYE